MINDELNLPFRFYNDIEKQNRYKDNCSATCNFNLISAPDRLLPFQVRTQIGTSPASFIKSWKIMCASDGILYRNLSALVVSQLEAEFAGGELYLTYDAASSIGDDIDCGSYYIEIQLTNSDSFPTTTNTFYSEVFNVVDFTVTPAIENLPIFTAWRFYDNIDKQNRDRSNCSASCDYYLISAQTNLLPFQFRILNNSPHIVTGFKLVAVDGSCEHILENNLISKFTDSDVLYDYFYYLGDIIEDLPCGNFYAVVAIDGVEYYSELIKITDMEIVVDIGDYILQETGFNILQETGFGILQE